MPCYRVTAEQGSTDPVYTIADQVYNTQLASGDRIHLDVVMPESAVPTMESESGVVSVATTGCPSGVGGGNGNGSIVGGLGPIGLGIGAGVAYYLYKNR